MRSMKKIKVLLSLMVIIFAVFYLSIRLKTNGNISLKSTPSPRALGASEEVGNLHEFNFKGKTYVFDYFVVDNIDNLVLIPNFQEKSTAKNLMADNKCKALASGGFYTKDRKPIGLFVYDGKKMKDRVENSFLNAVLSINDFGTPRIMRETPRDHLRTAIQTGPFLIENSFLLKNTIKNDEMKRRMIALVTGENKLVFLVIYSSDNVYTGPYLLDIPQSLDLLNKKYDLGIADAVNLDGGSASAFYSKDTGLSELSFIGSAFCLKN